LREDKEKRYSERRRKQRSFGKISSCRFN